MTDTRDTRAISGIDCPRCGAKKGNPCNFRPLPGRVACCLERRKANQERVAANTRDQQSAREIAERIMRSGPEMVIPAAYLKALAAAYIELHKKSQGEE